MNRTINFIKIFFILSLIFFSHESFSQMICITEDDTDWREIRANIVENIRDGANDFKLVRVNVHFMLRSNGTGNFTETGDNLGNSLTGYDFARDVINACNHKLSYNQQLSIPPGNSTPVNPKNYQYILDAVYFHRDDAVFNFASGSTIFNQYGGNTDSVINIIFSNGSGSSGYASTLSHFSKIKYTEIQGIYGRYCDYVNNIANGIQDDYEWVLHGTEKTINHELGHLFGLSHTVRYNHAPPCPTQTCQGSVNSGCDDDCNDTPTAWYIVDNLGGGHPACGWGGVVLNHPSYCANGQAGVPTWCSNNMMDYGQAEALSPCQLNIIHTGLDGGMTSYMLCDAITNNNTITSFSYPQIAYYGKKVNIGNSIGDTVDLLGATQANIYFKYAVVFYPNFKVEGSFSSDDYHKMEFIQSDMCN